MGMNKNVKCILPWIHVATNPDGQTRPCCISGFSNYFAKSTNSYPKIYESDFAQVLHEPAAQTIRRTFEDGSFPSACMICKKKEAVGGISKRMLENKKWYRYMEESVPTLRSLDIRMGNACNLKCIMCGPVESSSWDKELMMLKKNEPEKFTELFFEHSFKKENWHHIDSPIWNSLWNNLNNIEDIYFAGGEPLLQPKHDWLLDRIIEKGHAGHIKIQYNTNLTRLDDSLIKKWGEFKAVEVNISLDGISRINDYIRYPSIFSEVVNNIQRLDKTSDQVTIRITHTVNILNFYYLDRFLNWKRESKFNKVQNSLGPCDVGLNFIVFPSHLNLSCATNSLREKFLEKINLIKSSYEISEDFVSNLDSSKIYLENKSTSESDRRKLLQYLEYLDTTRGLSYRDTFSEIASDLL